MLENTVCIILDEKIRSQNCIWCESYASGIIFIIRDNKCYLKYFSNPKDSKHYFLMELNIPS